MRVDHLVWYAPDLAAGDAWFAERMDRASAYGGTHPGEGTCNRLVALAPDTYVEILGRDPDQPETNLDPEIRALPGAGLYHWAVSGADLAALRDRAAAAGLVGGDLVTGGRRRPDGGWPGWRLFGLRDHGFGALVPFAIDWLDSVHPALGAPRGASLVAVEARCPNPRGLQAIYDVIGLDVAVTAAPSPALRVTIESRRGRHVLATIDPLPRGYVI